MNNKKPIGKIMKKVNKNGKEYQSITIGNQHLIGIDGQVFELKPTTMRA